MSKKKEKDAVNLAQNDEQSDVNEDVVFHNRRTQIQGLTQTLYYVVRNGRKRTPMHIMNSQAIYDACKSYTQIKSFNNFGLCCSYDELWCHHNDIATYEDLGVRVANITSSL